MIYRSSENTAHRERKRDGEKAGINVPIADYSEMILPLFDLNIQMKTEHVMRFANYVANSK